MNPTVNALSVLGARNRAAAAKVIHNWEASGKIGETPPDIPTIRKAVEKDLSDAESRHLTAETVRKRIEGNTERPRLSVFRSTRHIYAQVIDDLAQKTLVSTSDVDAEKGAGKGASAGKKKDRAKQVGFRCLQPGIGRDCYVLLALDQYTQKNLMTSEKL